MPLLDPGKLLLIVGLAIAAVGGVIILGRRLGLSQLPAISFSSDGFSFFFPIVACIVVSILLTVVLNIILRLRG